MNTFQDIIGSNKMRSYRLYILFILTKEDAQYLAKDLIDRELSSEELRFFKKVWGMVLKLGLML